MGTERALPKEPIVLNITLLKEGIVKIRITLSKSIQLRKTYNYDLERKEIIKKEISFEVSKFKFENNLALLFSSEKLDDSENKASIKIEAVDIENKVKEMSIFEIEILKPLISVKLRKGNKPNQLEIEIKKEDREVGAVIKKFEFSAFDVETNHPVKINVIKYSLEEFIANIDDIPIIFDWKVAFKEIVINSIKPIILSMKAIYMDSLGNEYSSNTARITLKPAMIREVARERREIVANPIFNAIGFEANTFEMAPAAT
ncbi:MAG: hypothetical protein ACTSRP_17225 [Candidatus Helarchaeota archaeon]